MLNSEVAQYAKLNKISVSEAYSVSVLRIGGYLDGYQKGRADAINEYVTRFEAENITDANAERLKPFIFEMHRLAEQMQKGAEE